MVKSIGYFFRRPEFSPKDQYGSSQPSLTPVPEDIMTSKGSRHICGTQIDIKVKLPSPPPKKFLKYQFFMGYSESQFIAFILNWMIVEYW